jgi:cysteine desulfurase
MTGPTTRDTRYFDYAATAPMCDEAADELERWRGVALNPSSIHQSGQRARRLLEEARDRLAGLLAVPSSEVIFTGSATESANLALRGLLAATSRGPARSRMVLTSAIEHSCVRETLEHLAGQGGISIRKMRVLESGQAVPEWEQDQGPLDLLCLMHANNETGVVQDHGAALRLVEQTGCAWLCDASQSLGKVPVRLPDLGAGLLIGSSHKVGGPLGIALLAGPAVNQLTAQIVGGGQEDGRRGGTPAVALARAFAAAAAAAVARQEAEAERLRTLEEQFLGRLSLLEVSWWLNGRGERLPGFLNLSIPGLEAVEAAIALDAAGYRVSPGSACSTGVVEVSPVLRAMFPDDEPRARAGLRITMGRETTPEAVIGLAAELARVAQARGNLRDLHPPR